MCGEENDNERAPSTPRQFSPPLVPMDATKAFEQALAPLKQSTAVLSGTQGRDVPCLAVVVVAGRETHANRTRSRTCFCFVLFQKSKETPLPCVCVPLFAGGDPAVPLKPLRATLHAFLCRGQCP